MARITSKQAKELMEAYASVHNLQERQRFDPSKYDLTQPMGGLSNKEYAALGYSERKGLERASKQYLQKNPNAYTKIEKPDGTSLEKGDKGFEKAVDQGKDTVTKNVNSSLGKGSSNNNQSTQSNNNQQSTQSNNNNQQSNTLTTASGRESNLSDYAKSKVASMRKDMNTAGVKSNEGPSTVSSVNSTGTAQKVDNQSSSGSTGGSVKFSGQQLKGLLDSQKGIGNKGNQTTPSSQQPAPQQSSPQARPAPQQSSPQTRPAPQAAQGSAAQGAQQQRPGALSRLGSLAAKAVSGARNVAGNVKQGVQSAASNVKQGVQAVAGALANKGPIQGRQTGAQRRAQQQATRPAPQAQQARPAPQAQQARPVQAAPVAKPVPQAQPVAKPAAPQLSGAQRAQQMAKQRIAQGRNTVTGALKSAAKPKPRVTTWRDLE